MCPQAGGWGSRIWGSCAGLGLLPGWPFAEKSDGRNVEKPRGGDTLPRLSATNPADSQLPAPPALPPPKCQAAKGSSGRGGSFQRMPCLAVPPPCGQPGMWPRAPRHWGASGDTGRAKGILPHRAGTQPGVQPRPLQGPKVPHEQLPAVTLLLPGPREQGCRPAPESKPIVHWQPSQKRGFSEVSPQAWSFHCFCSVEKSLRDAGWWQTRLQRPWQ